MIITLEQLEEEYGGIAARATNLAPVMRVGGLMGVAEIKSRFDTQTDPNGATWAPLRFPRPEGGAIPLRNHGTLAASYSFESGQDFFRTGTNLRKARLLHYGGEVVPVTKKWLTIPLTKEAVYAGDAPSQQGLHFRKRKDSNVAGLFDANGVRHWLLVKRVVIPSRKQVGASPALLEKFRFVLVNYLRTGEL